ncbi:hypothetical protein HMPREF9129_2166 [Peptoniphilus indolicus ATCC 29427]|uniref:Uncharacterized protein n=2 Tax=Peptoniphilus indolicus TaxID=33030 RepID=G4D6Y6_9FIRM|nr:hypothetical protein [Peptoniphilus indolicus]EGY76336.1 hypothetical protein HMPREF9129_2166 [Peptoniphilus indolicus ATCC 29427]
MRNLDYENIFISTDRGIYNKKTPINSMKDAIKFCLESGIEIKNIEKMIKFTPKNLVEG